MIHDIHLYSKNPTNVVYEERLDLSPLKYQFYEQILSSVIHVIKTPKKITNIFKNKTKSYVSLYRCHAVPNAINVQILYNIL